MIRNTRLVLGLLVAAWVVTLVWQAVEHRRVRRFAREALIHRARDISDTLGLVMRSQRRFAGIISKDRLESALTEVLKTSDLSAIALLNTTGDVVASAGNPIDLETKELLPTGAHWDSHSVTLLNLVDLGTNVTTETGPNPPTIVLPREQLYSGFGTNRPPPRPPPPEDDGVDRPRTEPGVAPPFDRPGPASTPPGPPPDEGTNRPPRTRGWPSWRGGGERRPFWLSEAEYRTAVAQKAVHSSLIVLSTRSLQAELSRDLWLRSIISLLAGVSVAGFGLAWRNVAKSSELEVRLVRAAELNTRLKEMNLAAAGLAHETRNPLNIVRGLAQMISKHPEASTDIRRQSREIVDETDRVTAQLNEFINYSRPREVRRTAVALGPVVNEVVRALTFDVEEKCIGLQVPTDLPTIEADEQLLRQALFNLLLNAVQAVERGGAIQVVARRQNGQGYQLEISDNGPGVLPEHRTEIFKPYFTTHQKGTGLGLAVVQQIVLAHGWDIECLPNDPRGAIFRLSHLKPATA